MLIVVVIIGILASAILPRLTGAQAATRDTARKTALNQIAQGLELYNTSKGSYPDTITVDGISTEALSTPLVSDYMKSIPGDPNTSAKTNFKFGNNKTKESTAWKFVAVKIGENVALAVKVEKPDNANWSSDWAFTATSNLCDGKVTIGADNQGECKVADASKLLYVLKI